MRSLMEELIAYPATPSSTAQLPNAIWIEMMSIDQRQSGGPTPRHPKASTFTLEECGSLAAQMAKESPEKRPYW